MPQDVPPVRRQVEVLAQGKLPEARQASARATARTEKSEQPILRMFTQRIAARIHAASGERADIAEAHRSLDRTLGEATKAGLVGEQLETRLVLGELELGAGQETAARARLTKLRWEAESKGFGLIARRAGEFLGVTTVDADGLR